MSTAMDAAVVAALQADGTLASLATGGVWPDLAPEQATPPYLIVALESHEDVHEFPGQSSFERATYLVMAVDRADDGATANSVYNRAHTVLSGTLTVSGYTVMDVRRIGRQRSAERDGTGIWRFVSGRYVVEADPS